MVKDHMDYMLEAVEIVKKQIENRKEIAKEFVTFFKRKNYQKIQFVGSGTSYNIALTAKPFIQKVLGIEADVQWAYTFSHYDVHYVGKDTLVIFCSQSGCSTNTALAAQKLKEAGKDAIGFTKFSDSPLSKYVKKTIGYNFSEGDIVQYKGYISSSLTIMLYALEAALELKKITESEYSSFIEQFNRLPNKMEEAREAAIAVFNADREWHYKMGHLIALGCGPTMGAAYEVVLKYRETYGIPAKVIEMEEILHGSEGEITNNTTVLLFDQKNSAVHERLKGIYEKLFLLTNRVMLITDDESISGKEVVHISSSFISEEIAVLYQVIPYQYYAYKICLDLRVNANTKERKEFSNCLGIKLPGNKY